jgi:hypothetical protein
MSLPYIITKTSPITLDKNILENGAWNFSIYRRGISRNRYIDPITITSTGLNWSQISSGSENLFIEKGDEIIVNNINYLILDWSPSNLQIYTSAIIPAGTYTSKISKSKRIFNINYKDWYFREQIELKLTPNTSTCTTTAGDSLITVTSPTSFTALKTELGDFIELMSGADRVDIGYGLGKYPIAKIIDATSMRVTRPLLANNTINYKLIRSDIQ